MKPINIVYVDDEIEESLSKFLDEFEPGHFSVCYKEIKFDVNEGYESLIQNPLVQEANILIIDSLLYENKEVKGTKFTGEEFKIILKKYYPFIETIVITQNSPMEGAGTISKYDSKNCKKTAKAYYDEVLTVLLFDAYNNIQKFEVLAAKLRDNDSLDKYMKDKVLDSFDGINLYDELTKSDVDKLINEIKYLKLGQ